MSWKNTTNRYGSISIVLHWSTFFLLVAVYLCIELSEFYPMGSASHEVLKTWHFMLGLSIFVLAWFRFVLHLSQVSPQIEPEPAAWQKILAKTVNRALYSLMIGMPLGGWLILSSEGKSIPFYGLYLPPLIAENKDVAELIKTFHETVGNVGYYLIGLHSVATLFHHYFKRDNTIVRMLPRKK